MHFQNAIFAGGGSRCLWQVGFWDGANEAGLGLDTSVNYAAGTSAGCAMALVVLLGRGPEALALFKRLTAANPANIHWQNLKPGSGKPLFPHLRIYRQALEEFLMPDDLKNLEGKQLEFLMARFPRYMPSSLGTALAFTIYGLEKHITGVLHPRWTPKLGFTQIVANSREATVVGALVDAILASTCVPPVLAGDGFRGQRVLDGGIIDNVPAHLADGREGKTLVLLSKRYRQELPLPGQRVYVQPSERITLDKFDYANPEGLQQTYDLGRHDGAAFAAAYS